MFLIYVQITFPPSLLPSRLPLLEPVAATTANKVQSHGLRIAPAGGLEVHALIVPALRAFHLPSLRQSRIRRDVGDDRRLLAQRVLHLVPINQARRRVLDVVAVLALKLEPLLVLVLERVEDLLCVRTTRARTERERERERWRERERNPCQPKLRLSGARIGAKAPLTFAHCGQNFIVAMAAVRSPLAKTPCFAPGAVAPPSPWDGARVPIGLALLCAAGCPPRDATSEATS